MDDFGTQGPYVADIIVNQDPIAGERLYVRREPHARLLLGTEYTFLRREFRQHPRPQRKIPAVARRLLLTFGGSDPDRLTELALAALESVAVDGLEAVVLIGPSNARGAELETAGQGRANLQLLRNPPEDLVEWMSRCDLAVLAAGSTLWELAYCRAPCIALLTSEDQRLHGNSATARGMPVARVSAGAHRGDWRRRFRPLPRSAAAHDFGTNLAAMVDGLGGAAHSGGDAGRGSKRCMKVAMMQPTFLPWQGYFELIYQSERFVLRGRRASSPRAATTSATGCSSQAGRGGLV